MFTGAADTSIYAADGGLYRRWRHKHLCRAGSVNHDPRQRHTAKDAFWARKEKHTCPESFPLSGLVGALAVDKSRSQNQTSRASSVPIRIPRSAEDPYVQTPRPRARAGAIARPSDYVQTAQP
jgi:hypothetical protein